MMGMGGRGTIWGGGGLYGGEGDYMGYIFTIFIYRTIFILQYITIMLLSMLLSTQLSYRPCYCQSFLQFIQYNIYFMLSSMLSSIQLCYCPCYRPSFYSLYSICQVFVHVIVQIFIYSLYLHIYTYTFTYIYINEGTSFGHEDCSRETSFSGGSDAPSDQSQDQETAAVAKLGTIKCWSTLGF